MPICVVRDEKVEMWKILTIPIFDWGAKKARVKSSELAMESNQIGLDEPLFCGKCSL